MSLSTVQPLSSFLPATPLQFFKSSELLTPGPLHTQGPSPETLFLLTLCLGNSYSLFRSQFKPNVLKEELLPPSHMVP